GEVRPAKAGAAGAGLGAVTGLLGVGGGFLAVPALTRVLNLPVRRAIGTSLLVITVNSLAALGARAGTGTPLDWSVIAPFTAAAVLGAWDGKRYAQRLSGDTLRRLFAYALLAVAAFMLADAFI
ncbi:sulfite exporter TauE/SafE family protein, partial [Streptomyces anulatus]